MAADEVSQRMPPPASVTGRRPAVDVARVGALVIVVLGHLLLAVIDRVDGEVRGANLLELRPGWVWLAALAPMPVFFAAGGWANATSGPVAAATRIRTLVGLGAVVVGTWSAAVIGMVAATGDAGIVGDGARIATQPLWFLAAYLPFAAAGRWLARLAASHVVAAVGGCLVVLAILDGARFGVGAPTGVGWPGFHLAWIVPWLLGGWWRSRVERGGFDERRAGLALAAAGATAAAVLVATAGYAPALIDAVPGDRSNTTPPTLYTAVAGIAQVGLLLVAAGGLDRIGRRWRRLWDRAGEAAVAVYVWHLSALALCAAGIAAGVPVPRRLTTLWWLTRPVWWAVVLAVTLVFVAVTAAARARLARRRGAVPAAVDPATLVPTEPALRWPMVAGIVVAAGGGAAVGLEGPQSASLAAGCTALFVGGWLLLGGRARPAGAR